MLIRAHDDASHDPDRWRAFVTSEGFGHFIAGGRDRAVPVVVPTQFVLDSNTIVFHLARQNPVFEALAENDQCLLSVAGDWAYIPAAWKALGHEDPRRGLPTTYYAAVQLTGTATVHDRASEVAGVLKTQLQDLEPDADLVDPSEHGKHLGAIRGITVEVSAVRAKFKFGGNADDAHREQVAEQLVKRRGPGDLSARAQMT